MSAHASHANAVVARQAAERGLAAAQRAEASRAGWP